MFSLDKYAVLQNHEICRLRGGRVRNLTYWVCIQEGNVAICTFEARLLNQFGSQRSPRHPEGYELFSTPYGTQRFDLASSTIPAPVIEKAYFSREATSLSVSNRVRTGCIVRTPGDPLLLHVLGEEQARFRLACSLRTSIRGCREKLHIAIELMSGIMLKKKSVEEEARDFEMQLLRVPLTLLSDLADLLRIPDTNELSHGIQQAA